MAQTKLSSHQEYMMAVMGQNGFRFLDGSEDTSSTHPSETYVAIQVIEEAVLTTVIPDNNGDALSAETIPAGTVLVGNFTSINQASGKSIAYRA